MTQKKKPFVFCTIDNELTNNTGTISENFRQLSLNSNSNKASLDTTKSLNNIQIDNNSEKKCSISVDPAGVSVLILCSNSSSPINKAKTLIKDSPNLLGPDWVPLKVAQSLLQSQARARNRNKKLLQLSKISKSESNLKTIQQRINKLNSLGSSQGKNT